MTDEQRDQILLSIQSNIIFVQKDISVIKDDVAELNSRVKVLEEKVDNLTERVEVLEEKVDNLTEKVGNLEYKYDELEPVILYMQNRDDTNEKRFKSHKKILNNHESRICSLEARASIQ